MCAPGALASCSVVAIVSRAVRNSMLVSCYKNCIHVYWNASEFFRNSDKLILGVRFPFSCASMKCMWLTLVNIMMQRLTEAEPALAVEIASRLEIASRDAMLVGTSRTDEMRWVSDLNKRNTWPCFH
jgi:hypothetical protein